MRPPVDAQWDTSSYIFHSRIYSIIYIFLRARIKRKTGAFFIYLRSPAPSPLFLLIYFMSPTLILFLLLMLMLLAYSFSFHSAQVYHIIVSRRVDPSAVDADKHGPGQGKPHWLQLQSLHQNDPSSMPIFFPAKLPRI